MNALGITQEQLEETHFQTPQDYIVKAENDDDTVKVTRAARAAIRKCTPPFLL